MHSSQGTLVDKMTAAPATDGPPTRPPAGALRILSRADGGEILILHDDGTPRILGPGEQLAHVSWYASTEVARAVSRECSRLLIAANFQLDRRGWHAFHVSHLKTLVRTACTHLNLAAIPPTTSTRQAWTGERIAWLGFLVGRGLTAKKIAEDPRIASNENNVYRQVHRFGLHLSDAPQGRVSPVLPLETLHVVDRAAACTGLTRDAYLRRFLVRAAAEGLMLEPAGV